MQLASVIVRIEDNVNHAVPKQNVTPAEIIVLRHIHGENAVVEIRATGSKGISHQEEFQRLKTIYGSAGAMSAEQKPGVVLDQLFPGAMKKLPVSLADIGVSAAQQAATPAPAPVQEEEIVDEHEPEIEPESEADETGNGEEGSEPAEVGAVASGPPEPSYPGWPGQG